jgi:hypothetical protein
MRPMLSDQELELEKDGMNRLLTALNVIPVVLQAPL